MNIVCGIIIGLLILMLLVVAHEFGHFIMCRLGGVKVKEFGICMPPRLVAWVRKEIKIAGKDGTTITVKKWVKLPKSEWQKEQNDLIFSINCLPIGGFCSMDGESAADKRKGTFGAASFWTKTEILFGGVAMNWLVAGIILTILAWTGMPQFIPNQFYLGNDAQTVEVGRGVVVQEIVEGSPAAAAGFQKDDEIIAINGQSVASGNEVTALGKENAGKEVTYRIKRGGEEQDITAKLNGADAPYALGVSMASYGQTLIRSTWSAPIVGFGLTVQLTGETFKGLGELVWNLVSGVARQFSFSDEIREEGRVDIGAAGEAVSGPVGIVGVIFPAFASSGLANLAFLTALISVSLACMNVLPIPALDGGRWLLIVIYKLRRKELTKETEEKIVSRAFMILLALIVLVTALDILKFF